METNTNKQQQRQAETTPPTSTTPIQDLIYTYVTAQNLITLILILYSIYRIRKAFKKFNCILLVGLANSGKTSYFTRLVTGKHLKTVSSIKENDTTLVKKSGKCRLVDLPGIDRIRTKFWEDYRQQATKILFLVNEKDFPEEREQVSEFLYQVLSDKYVNKNHIPVVLVLNVHQSNSTIDTISPVNGGMDLVLKDISKRINVIRETQKGQLDKTSNATDDTYYLGTKGKDFSFDHLSIPFRHLACGINNVPDLIEDLIF